MGFDMEYGLPNVDVECRYLMLIWNVDMECR